MTRDARKRYRKASAPEDATAKQLTEEIAMLRELIRLAYQRADDAQTMQELLKILDHTSSAADRLARLVKTQAGLDGAAGDTLSPRQMLDLAIQKLKERSG